MSMARARACTSPTCSAPARITPPRWPAGRPSSTPPAAPSPAMAAPSATSTAWAATTRPSWWRKRASWAWRPSAPWPATSTPSSAWRPACCWRTDMSWNATWREAALPALAAREWDLIVVGGGIGGAGILREAARRGWRCLLLEQRDFAWGTSSRSSKMVHGGLRYLAKGQLRLARDAVRERQRLLGELPGLVEPLPFLFPHERGRFPGPRLFGGLLGLYDALAGQRRHRYHPAGELPFLAPGLTGPTLRGASHFGDAITDDARLVLRVLQEARADGGEALNGVRVVERLRERGRVVGVLA